MNVLDGEVAGLKTEEGISLVKVQVGTLLFTAIVLDSPASSPYLAPGHPVKLLFKETEVIIAKGAMPLISVRNRIGCRVEKISEGLLLCELTLVFESSPGGRKWEIRSIITREACEQLDLREEDAVIALIKTNEVSLSG